MCVLWVAEIKYECMYNYVQSSALWVHCTLPVAVSRSFSGETEILYVFPAFWISSCLLIMPRISGAYYKGVYLLLRRLLKVIDGSMDLTLPLIFLT